MEVESFPKPDFPNMMNKMEMSDMADFDLDFEPNKVSIVKRTEAVYFDYQNTWQSPVYFI